MIARAFVNFTLFNILKIGEKPNRFAVFIEPLTQIDLIVRNNVKFTNDAPVQVIAPMAIGSPVRPKILASTIELNGVIQKPNRFAVFIEPLTQIDLIVRYAPVLYGTNALIGMVNACIICHTSDTNFQSTKCNNTSIDHTNKSIRTV
jgi:hypothetical protein